MTALDALRTRPCRRFGWSSWPSRTPRSPAAQLIVSSSDSDVLAVPGEGAKKPAPRPSAASAKGAAAVCVGL